ncbi:MAG: DUF1631 family protein [Luteimonas sp.]
MSIHHPDMNGQVARGPEQLLDELKRIAVEQLGAVPAGLYRPIEEQLHQSLRGDSEGTQRNDLMAVLALRQRGSHYVMKFRELIGRSFDGFCGREVLGSRSEPMGLVRENELEFHLAGQRLAESIGGHYQRQLDMLGLRFESLAAAMGLPSTGNPVGAALLASAFVQTFSDVELSATLQPLLFRQYERELTSVLDELYGRLNTQLAANGFHADPPRPAAAAPAAPAAPAFQPSAWLPPSPLQAGAEIMTSRQAGAWLEAGIGGMVPTEPAPMRPAPVGAPVLTAAAGSPPSGSPPQGQNADMFRTPPAIRIQHEQLRDMLHRWREGMHSGAGGTACPIPDRRLATRREMQMQEVVSVASLLQGDGARNFEAALSGKCDLHAAIREELVEGARRLGLDPDQTCLDPRQEDAIDLTGLLFESLTKGQAMLQESRRLFARLVMSYVKVALTDEGLFVSADHPARRLLDALAIGCEGNDGVSPQDREILDHADQLVGRVVAEFNEDIAIFELSANEMQSLIDQQHRRADLVERRTAETVHGRERLQLARAQAAAALAERTDGRKLTPTIAHFMDRHWQHHLVQVLLRDSESSARYQRVLALADQLVALDQAAASGNDGNVAAKVLALQPGLVEVLSSSGLDEQVAGEWMAGLARTLAFPDATRELRTHSAQPVPADQADESLALRLVGGNDSLDFDPNVSARMRDLVPGDWMRLGDGTAETPVKVAWISPITGRLLLVNRRGTRQLVASPAQLASLVRSGKLFAEADEQPFAEAMRLVRRKLSRSAVHAA